MVINYFWIYSTSAKEKEELLHMVCTHTCICWKENEKSVLIFLYNIHCNNSSGWNSWGCLDLNFQCKRGIKIFGNRSKGSGLNFCRLSIKNYSYKPVTVIGILLGEFNTREEKKTSDSDSVDGSGSWLV